MTLDEFISNTMVTANKQQERKQTV